MKYGLTLGKSQIRYGFGLPWNVRRALLPGLHPETVLPKHAGIYGNLSMLITAEELSAAQTARKVMRQFFPQNVTGHQEKEAGRLLTLNASAAHCIRDARIWSEKRFLSAVMMIFMKSVSEVLLIIIY